MGKYKRLATNTILLAVSSFSSKILNFLLTRLYTSNLGTASYGVSDILNVSANFLIPLVSLGISQAVVRFGLEKGYSKKGIFTNGIIAIFTGFAIMLCFWPLFNQYEVLEGKVYLLYIYILFSCLRTLCCQFVRAKLYMRLYAIDGILATIYTIGFNVLFLVVLDMGVTGYMLSIILADLCSIIGLFIIAKLWQYIDFSHFYKKLYFTMLRYSLPLIPSQIFYWAINGANRFFIVYYWSEQESGMFGAATKLPGVINIITTIFTEAWQLSAVTDGQDEEKHNFFTSVFTNLSSAVFVVTAGLILFCRPIMWLLVSSQFRESWQFVPYLLVATAFSCLVSFLNSIYMVEKRSVRALVTMMVGAVVSIVCNALLIKPMGPMGAALSTLISFFVTFVVRMIDTRQFIRIDIDLPRLIFNIIFLLSNAVFMTLSVPLWQVWCSILTLAIIIVNFNSLYKSFKQILGKNKLVTKKA